MQIRPRAGFGLVLVLALALSPGCTKKHLYTTDAVRPAPSQESRAGQASAQGAVETAEVMTMGEELAEESAPQVEARAPEEPGLVETTYANEPAPDTRPVVETTTRVEPATRTEPPESNDVLAPMSPEAMAEEPMPFEPPADVTADPGHQPGPARPAAADVAYDQTGLASWVADENKGLPTASGELYDPADLTAAHRTYPLNTRLEVTNLDNGRSVVVRINDRGPFKKERIVDLSRAAAGQLGIIDQSAAEVGVRVVDEAPAAPAVQSAVPAAGGIYIQVGAFSNQAAADEVLDKLVRAGYAESRVVRAGGENVYRVQAGGFATEDDAKSALELLSEPYPGSFLVKE